MSSVSGLIFSINTSKVLPTHCLITLTLCMVSLSWCRKSPNPNEHIGHFCGTNKGLFQFFPPCQWAQWQQSLDPFIGSQHHLLPKGHLLLGGVHPVHRDAIAQTWKEGENFGSCTKSSHSKQKYSMGCNCCRQCLHIKAAPWAPPVLLQMPTLHQSSQWSHCKSHKMQNSKH